MSTSFNDSIRQLPTSFFREHVLDSLEAMPWQTMESTVKITLEYSRDERAGSRRCLEEITFIDTVL